MKELIKSVWTVKFSFNVSEKITWKVYKSFIEKSVKQIVKKLIKTVKEQVEWTKVVNLKSISNYVRSEKKDLIENPRRWNRYKLFSSVKLLQHMVRKLGKSDKSDLFLIVRSPRQVNVWKCKNELNSSPTKFRMSQFGHNSNNKNSILHLCLANNFRNCPHLSKCLLRVCTIMYSTLTARRTVRLSKGILCPAPQKFW